MGQNDVLSTKDTNEQESPVLGLPGAPVLVGAKTNTEWPLLREAMNATMGQ